MRAGFQLEVDVSISNIGGVRAGMETSAGLQMSIDPANTPWWAEI